MATRRLKVHAAHISVGQNWSGVMGTGSRWGHLFGPTDSLPFENNRKRTRAGPSTGWCCLEETSPNIPQRALLNDCSRKTTESHTEGCALKGPGHSPQEGVWSGAKSEEGLCCHSLLPPGQHNWSTHLVPGAALDCRRTCGQDRPCGCLRVAHTLIEAAGPQTAPCGPWGEGAVAGVYPGI